MRIKPQICLFLLCTAFYMQGQEKIITGYNASLNTESTAFSDGSIALCATSTPINGPRSSLVIRFDACGDTLWARKFFEGTNFTRILRIQNDDTNLWLAAAIGASHDSAVALIKIDGNTGQVLISKRISAPINFVWYQFHIDVDGNLIFTGNATTNNGPANTILKLNPQAQEIHAFQYSDVRIWGMSTPALSGGVLNIVGRMVFKVDRNGNIEWIKRYDNSYQSNLPPISLPDGYLIFGKFVGALDRTNVFKIDLQGNVVWSSENFLNINAGACVINDEGHLLIPYTDFSVGNGQWGIIEIDENGQYLSSYRLPFNLGYSLSARDLEVLPNGRLVISGMLTFDLNPNIAQSIRWLDEDLSNLATCPATFSPISTEPATVSADPVSPVFSPDRYGDFTIVNKAYPNSGLPLNIADFCTIDDPLVFDLGQDRSICPGDTNYLGIDLGGEDYDILWSTGATSDSIQIIKPGLYWCEISQPCGGDSFRDSIYLDFFPAQPIEARFSPEIPILGDSILFEAPGVGEMVQWTYGSTVIMGNPVRVASEAQMAEGVIVSYIDTNSCTQRDTLFPRFRELELVMPNAFTPNGDGLNDVFGPHPSAVYFFRMEIFDRYGKRQAQLENQSWDGEGMSAGAYTYFMIYQIQPGGEERIHRGIVNLVR
ncbi:T9SS type B sorting domain-containing protein [Croceimicrobium hydrocarbonivorans]|uniref:Gliding motility-associated C-terminal domain-containing protein n=1 Tax=Croceimicrobium hydrocarbonivorans TaxID=2761580 RepID=A0A7H0VCD3_9FLAO|nr:gliding motility-associated C-terminal domain-containing protein [Croceimicrobium hydrocarbonivorans]QNR23381.1 gliding motility-associated C-terminal domain-containing protein [Croceimicrobium hydrocarbonivorans]